MAYISFQPSDYFNTVLYTGNASTNAITGVGFQPDWLWIKSRSRTDNHILLDVLRGTNRVISNTNNAQSDISGDGFTSIDSDGFTLNGSGGGGETNASSATFASWNWKAGGSGSSNTDGSINTTSTSVSTTAGFSISTYTGTGSAATIGHGLGAIPDWILLKSTSATAGWRMYHSALGATKNLILNETGGALTQTAVFNDTAPTSSVFTIGNAADINTSSANYLAYCFAEKKGFSKFGLYYGNNSTWGPFINCGFKPAWIMIKEYGASGEGWAIFDSKRNPGNLADNSLQANITQAEEDLSSKSLNILSNGFKLKTTDGLLNGSGKTYVYMSFAEHPVVASNGDAGTAR